jgi:hypothetical protein
MVTGTAADDNAKCRGEDSVAVFMVQLQPAAGDPTAAGVFFGA